MTTQLPVFVLGLLLNFGSYPFAHGDDKAPATPPTPAELQTFLNPITAQSFLQERVNEILTTVCPRDGGDCFNVWKRQRWGDIDMDLFDVRFDRQDVWACRHRTKSAEIGDACADETKRYFVALAGQIGRITALPCLDGNNEYLQFDRSIWAREGVDRPRVIDCKTAKIEVTEKFGAVTLTYTNALITDGQDWERPKEKGSFAVHTLTLTSDGNGQLFVDEEDRTMPRYRYRHTQRREIRFKFL